MSRCLPVGLKSFRFFDFVNALGLFLLSQICFCFWTPMILPPLFDPCLSFWTPIFLVIWLSVITSTMYSGNEKKCCVPNCNITCSDNVVLHHFPNPNKDLDRFRTWIYAISGDILALDNNTIFKNRRVCHCHFEPRYHTRGKKLSNNAVPTMHLPGFEIMKQRQPMMDVSIKSVVNIEKTHDSNVAEASTSKGFSISMDVTNKSVGKNQEIFEVEASTSKVISSTSGITTHVHQNKKESSDIGLKRKIKKLTITKNQYAAQLKKALKLSENASFQRALRNFTSMAFIFTMLQFREINKHKMGRRFTKKEKIMALALYKQGPKAYRWLRRVFVLPAPARLSRMISKAALKPGINENLFRQLEKQAKKMKTSEKLCILLFDEIALTAHFDYNRKTDEITGFVNNGNSIKNKIADHALVFMIRGIHRNYKQPISYTFCAGSTHKEEIVKQIKDLIRKLKSIGFKALATVCDQGASNVSAINYLINERRSQNLRMDTDFNNNVFEVDGDEIVPLYDPPHLIKGIRNNLLDKNLICLIDKQEKTAKRHHIMQLYQENPSYKGLRLMPKLTENHVNPRKMLKMKVKCATQVFSRTVATNMGYLSEKGILPEECKDTADIILFFDTLFDSVNGSYDNSKKRSGKPLLGPLTPKSCHQKVWTESKPVLSSMKFTKGDGRSKMVPSVKHWLFTIENLELLKNKLFYDHELKSIWLRHFNQDPLENFFGCIRSHGYRNISPSCAGFEAAFAALLVNNLSSNHSPGSNCEMDSASAFKSLSKLFFQNNVTSSPSPINLDLDLIVHTEIFVGLENKNDPRVIAELEYVTGYILRKTKIHVFKNCKQCKKCFYNMMMDNIYIQRREHLSNKKCLSYPSRDLTSCFSDIQDVIHHIMKSDSLKRQIKNYMKTVLYVMIDFNFIKCIDHKKDCIEYIFDLSCRLFLCNWCKEINKILSGRRLDFDHSDGVQKMAHEYYNKRRK